MPHPPDKATMVFAHKHAIDAKTERCWEQQVCLLKKKERKKLIRIKVNLKIIFLKINLN